MTCTLIITCDLIHTITRSVVVCHVLYCRNNYCPSPALPLYCGVMGRGRRRAGGDPVKPQNTHTKCMKSKNYISLLQFSLLLPNCEGSHSALIYKFKSINLNMFGGGLLVMAALLSEQYERLLN